MFVRFSLWLLQFLFLTLILAYEQALSIPYLTFMATILIVQGHTAFGRQALLVGIGLLIATVYSIPLGVGVLLVLGGIVGWKQSEVVMKQDGARLLLVSLLLASIVGVVSRVSLTSSSGLFLTFNLLISLAIVRLMAISSNKDNRDNL